MDDLLSVVVLGLASAAVYAIAASGLVLTYTASGIFNFAHGAVAMLAAFTYWQLRSEDAWGWPAPVAFVVVVFVVAPLAGLVIDRVLMRGLHDAATTTKVVVTVGLLVAFIALANVIWPPASVQPTLSFFFGTNTVSIGGVNVEYHRIATFLTAVVVAGGLAFVLKRTATGVAMRAVVDDRDLAALNGADPRRVSAVSWMLGTSLAALAGILITPLLSPSLDATQLTLLVINAYAAALFGRLRSLPLTVVGAVVLGLAVEAVANASRFDIDPPTWLNRDTVPVIVLFVVLLALPPERAALRAGHTGRARVPSPRLDQALVAAAALVAVAAVVPTLVGATTLTQLGYGLALAVVMLSLVPLTGYAGQLSLAPLGFAGIGAIVMVELGPNGQAWALVVAAAVAAAVGGVVALPALRLRGLYLALATMAFALFLEKAVFNQVDRFQDGNGTVAPLSLFGLSTDNRHANFVLLAVAFAVLGIGVVALRRGPFGRRLQAMADSPTACTTLGLDLTRTKVEVFALSAAIAAVGGALLASWRGAVGPENYSLLTGALPGLAVVLLAVVGGIAAVAGALIGGLALVVMPLVGERVPSLADLMLLLPGLVGIGLARNPGGMATDIARLARAGVRRERPLRSAALVPERLGIDGPLSADEVRAVEAELGLVRAGCEVPR